MRDLRRPPKPVSALAAIGVVLFALPVLALLVEAPWGSLLAELSAPETRTATRVSLLVSLTATVLAVVLGVPLAFALANLHFWGKPVVRTIITVPLVLPPVVTGVALASAFGRRTTFGDLFGFGLTSTTVGAILAATLVATPFLVLTVEGTLRSTDPGYENLAATLGAPPLARWWRVSLPLARPGILAGAILAWARALGEFGATITFAGNIQGVTRTLPLEISIALENPESRDRAIAISMFLLAVSLTVLITLRDRWIPRR
ncbi:MAG: molybdate ABC transporter permease subunit [Acidimicrobiia bacterium]|nr:molybdate ABC transporter permease subunit [Acidimicrobiia bacterium]